MRAKNADGNSICAGMASARRLPPHLIEELRAGRVIAFVGAGFSAPAGFPGWKQLLLKITQAAKTEGALPADVHELVGTLLGAQWPSAAELDQAAQLIDDSLPPSADGQPQERLVGFMRRFLVPREYPLPGVMERRLALLRDLPFRCVLTTNFNPLISGITPFDASAPAAYRCALRSAVPCPCEQLPPAEVSSIASSDADGLHYSQASCPVLQIHGALREPRSVVFTREGYRRLLYSNPYAALRARSDSQASDPSAQLPCHLLLTRSHPLLSAQELFHVRQVGTLLFHRALHGILVLRRMYAARPGPWTFAPFAPLPRPASTQCPRACRTTVPFTSLQLCSSAAGGQSPALLLLLLTHVCDPRRNPNRPERATERDRQPARARRRADGVRDHQR